MNNMIKTISALALGLGFAGAALAQPDGSVVGNPVYITGSTAFRNQVFAALKDLNLTTVASQDASGSNWFTLSGTIADNTGTGSLGTLQSSGPATAFCSWSGSVEGVQALLYATNNATYQNVDSGSFYTGTFSHNGADLALSDIGQGSCYQGAGAGSVNYTPTRTAITLVELRTAADTLRHAPTGIAVQPFTFVVDGNAQSISNITENQFIDLFHSGTYPLSFFTGNTSDAGTSVYAVGRYNLSGTRATAVLDFGYSQLQSLSQYALSADGSTTPGLASTDTTPVPSTGNQWLPVANSGYYSGGNVGSAIQFASTNGAPAAVAYIAWSDSSKIIGNPTNTPGPITYMGQSSWLGGTFPNTGNWNTNGVINGSYNLWTYERMYESQAVSGGSQSAITGQQSSAAFVQEFGADLIAAIQYEITHTASFSKFGSPSRLLPTALLESQMQVFKASDGADVQTGN